MSELCDGTDYSALCIKDSESIFIKQDNYPIALGGLGIVYKCTRKNDTGSDEVSHRLGFSRCTHSGFRSQLKLFGLKI